MRTIERAALRWPVTVIEMGRQDLELEIDHRLEETCFHLCALAGYAPPDQRGEHALRQCVSGHHVCDSKSHGRWRIIAAAGQPEQPDRAWANKS